MSSLNKQKMAIITPELMARRYIYGLSHPARFKRLYRYFTKREYADDFCSGKAVLVSTLNTCRIYEDPEQGDPDEGVFEYSSGPQVIQRIAAGDPWNRRFKEIGFDIDNCIDMSIDIGGRTELTDAFVLCCTSENSGEHISDAIGKFAVEITNPRLAFTLITQRLTIERPVCEALLGEVAYKSIEYKGLEKAPGFLGFVKKQDPYGKQREVRMLWTPHDDKGIEPKLIEVPGLNKCCRPRY